MSRSRVEKVARGMVKAIGSQDSGLKSWEDLTDDERKEALALSEGLVQTFDALIKPHVTRLGKILRGEDRG